MERAENEKKSRLPKIGKTPKRIAGAFAAVMGLTAIADGWTVSGPDQVKMLLKLGDPIGFAPQGFSLKMPIITRPFAVTTSVQEHELPSSSVALQNGTITAEDIQSSVYIKLNGTRAEMEETVELIRTNMPDFEDRLLSLAEGELRDTVRLTSVASADSDEKQEVTQIDTAAGELNFLDTESVGNRVAEKLQTKISKIIPGTVTVGDEQKPRIEAAEFRIGNFEFDEDYLARRETVANARAAAEAARFEEAEKERKADALRAEAAGEKDAAIARAEGEAEGIALKGAAEAEALEKRIAAAGGADALREQTLAERWNGEAPRVVGGDSVIVDSRYAPGTQQQPKVVAPIAAVDAPNP